MVRKQAKRGTSGEPAVLQRRVSEAWAGRRLLDCSQGPASLSVKGPTLLVQRARHKQEPTPLAEAGLVLLGHPGVKLTQQVLAELLRHDAAVAVVDADGEAQGVLVPLGNDTEGLWNAQLHVERRLLGTLWQKIVRAKILAQATELEAAGAGGRALARLAAAVQPGDPTGIERRAERRFHHGLLSTLRAWRPQTFASDAAMFVSGRAPLRAPFAQAVLAAGLHPSVGLRPGAGSGSRRGRARAGRRLGLADDLMEPLAPLADRAAAEYLAGHPPDRYDPGALRRHVLDSVFRRVAEVPGASGLVDVALLSARSLAESLQSGQDQFRPAGTPAHHEFAQQVYEQLWGCLEAIRREDEGEGMRDEG